MTLNMCLQWDPAISLVSIYQGEIKAYVYAKTTAWMVIEALSAVAKKLETDQMSINSWMVKKIVIYIYNQTLFSDLKEGSTDTCNNMNESLNN